MLDVNRIPTALTAVACTFAGCLAFAQPSSAEPRTGGNTTVVFTSETRPTLDLRIGDLTEILTPEQLDQALGMDFHPLSGAETAGDEQMEQIEVRAVREQQAQFLAPIPFGFASIAWAFQNPADAWRIFFPVEVET